MKKNFVIGCHCWICWWQRFGICWCRLFYICPLPPFSWIQLLVLVSAACGNGFKCALQKGF